MKNKLYFQNLDIIRFIAALLIVLGHGFIAWRGYFLEKDTEYFSTIWNNLYINTGLGVELFFLISGFLITYILLKEKERTGKIHIFNFFVRRALRIWPLYFLLILITPLLIFWLGNKPPTYTPYLLFYGNFEVIAAGETEYPFSHLWSIAVEEQFYLVWPFIIAFVPKKRLSFVFISVIGASIFFRYIIIGTEKSFYHLYYNTFCRMDTLAIGALIALYFDSFRNSFIVKKIFFQITFLLLVLVFFFTTSNRWQNPAEVLFKKYIYIILMIPVTFYFITKKTKKVPNKLVRITTYFGKSSYGLYMIHNFFIVIIIKRIMFNNSIHIGWVFWLIYLLLTFVTVAISFELFEKPILRLKKYFTIIKTRDF